MNAVRGAAKAEPIRFRGVAPRVDGFVPYAYRDLDSERLPVLIQLNGEHVLTMARPTVECSELGDRNTKVRLRLSESTPPGRYPGTLAMFGVSYPIEVQVDGHAHIDILPSRLSLEAKAGGELVTELTVSNLGNVPVELPREYDLALLNASQLPRAFAAALREQKQENRDWFRQFAEEVGQDSALMTLELLTESRLTRPGDIRTVPVRMRVPQNVQAGHWYYAALLLLNDITVVSVHIQPTASVGRRRRSRATQV